jgi:hypothetical protein
MLRTDMTGLTAERAESAERIRRTNLYGQILL